MIAFLWIDADYWPSWSKSARHLKMRFPNAFIFYALQALKLAGHPVPHGKCNLSAFPWHRL